jgi:hypothetical protein
MTDICRPALGWRDGFGRFQDFVAKAARSPLFYRSGWQDQVGSGSRSLIPDPSARPTDISASDAPVWHDEILLSGRLLGVTAACKRIEHFRK